MYESPCGTGGVCFGGGEFMSLTLGEMELCRVITFLVLMDFGRGLPILIGGGELFSHMVGVMLLYWPGGGLGLIGTGDLHSCL